LARQPKWLRLLNRWEQKTNRAWPFNRLSDHVILEFERVA
jgi:hypothetical protein